MPMVESWKRWEWRGVSAVHRTDDGGTSSCTGRVYHYAYRIHGQEGSSYERCIGISWCSTCREHTAGLIFVPRDRDLWDALADLPPDRRETLYRSSKRLRDHLDRIARRGGWPDDEL